MCKDSHTSSIFGKGLIFTTAWMIEVLDVLGQPQKMVITAHNLRPHISEEETPFHDNFLHLADLALHKVVSWKTRGMNECAPKLQVQSVRRNKVGDYQICLTFLIKTFFYYENSMPVTPEKQLTEWKHSDW